MVNLVLMLILLKMLWAAVDGGGLGEEEPDGQPVQAEGAEDVEDWVHGEGGQLSMQQEAEFTRHACAELPVLIILSRTHSGYYTCKSCGEALLLGGEAEFQAKCPA